MRITSRQALLNNLRSFHTDYPEEKEFILRFMELLNHTNCYQRTYLPGHITGSALIVNTDITRSLLVHHAKLNKWLQPGGHADGDENILQVALQEVEEETGLHAKLLHPGVFDLDIHTIPARPNFQEHLHFDVRFLVQASEEEITHVSEESHDVRWFTLTELPTVTENHSIKRMIKKLRSTAN